MKRIGIIALFCGVCAVTSAQNTPAESYPFRDSNLPVEVRVKDLISRLTLQEKVEMMKH